MVPSGAQWSLANAQAPPSGAGRRDSHEADAPRGSSGGGGEKNLPFPNFLVLWVVVVWGVLDTGML